MEDKVWGVNPEKVWDVNVPVNDSYDNEYNDDDYDDDDEMVNITRGDLKWELNELDDLIVGLENTIESLSSQIENIYEKMDEIRSRAELRD